MLRMAIQAKGRLNEDTMGLLADAGIDVAPAKRKLVAKASGFPIEVLYLRDDDIPQAVHIGVADVGIVGLNEVAEREMKLHEVMRLGFGTCRISLAIPKAETYSGLDWFKGKCVATSYPNILSKFFYEQGIDADIYEIAGSVEIAPAVGLADAIFDIVSSGGTLIQNGLKEVEKLKFRFSSIVNSRGYKYVLMNIPRETLPEAVKLIPGMRSPTVLPLADEAWCSLHTVLAEDVLWEKVEQLKALGAEGILVLNLENMVI